MGDESAAAEAIQVLEFDLGGERFCVGIEHVSEIVEAGEISRVPETPPHVVGVMALRGETTRIVDPKRILDVDGDADGDYVIVLEGDADEPTGWLVDAVDQVTAVDGDDVDGDRGGRAVAGVVMRDEDFVVLVDPDAVDD